MNYIEAAIKDLEIRKETHEIQAKRIGEGIALLRDLLCDIPAESERPEEPVRSDPSPSPRGGQRPGKAFSKYKGVTRLSPLKDGSLRFRASVWREGKNRPLGNFVGEHAEREAALAAARARGDTGLIAELEADLEQAENNPDKTDWAWQCNRCGHDHHQLDRPAHCQRCKHTGMRRFEKGKRNLPEGQR